MRSCVAVGSDLDDARISYVRIDHEIDVCLRLEGNRLECYFGLNDTLLYEHDQK